MKNRGIRSFLSTLMAVLLAGMLLDAPVGAVSGDASGISVEAADCDMDNGVKISDVTALINYLLAQHW